MGKATLETSLAQGGHRRLARLAGDWSGSTRVWFKPDGPPTEPEPQQGSMCVVLGGRFVVHEYACGSGDAQAQGIALLGLHLDDDAFQSAWIDSVHNGSNIMLKPCMRGGREPTTPSTQWSRITSSRCSLMSSIA